MKTLNEAYIYIPEDKQLPNLGEQDENCNSIEDYTLHIKLFDIASSWTWYIAEYDKESNIAFCYVEGFENEWGDVWLGEFEDILSPLGIPRIERDLNFKPTKFKDLKR